MVIDRDGLIALLTNALWNGSKSKKQIDFEIYEGVYDIMHNGTENGLSFEGLNIEEVADDILYAYGKNYNDHRWEMLNKAIEEIERTEV